MDFLSPMMLSFAAALAVPLWLHLRRKRKQVPVPFPSLRYLKMAAARVRRQAKVEDVVLLVLRCLLLGLLAAAFARPVVRTGGRWLGSGRAIESVIVIDATASMGAKSANGTRLDAAKQLAREWIDGLGPGDAAALWVLTDRLDQPVPRPINDRAHLHRQLDAVAVSDGSSSLAPVFSAAREWAEVRGVGRKELVVVTDNQPAAWDWPAQGFFQHSWNPDRAELVVLVPETPTPNNLAVESVGWDGGPVAPGGLLTGRARLVNHGEAVVDDVLECRVDGQSQLRKPVTLPAGGSLDVALAVAVPAVTGPVLAGEVSLAGDALGCDDQWNFALPVRHPPQSLVIDRVAAASGSLKPSYFLARALAAGGAGKVTVTDKAEWTAQDGIDTIWFSAGIPDGTDIWPAAVAFARAGGTVVVGGDVKYGTLPDPWPVTPGDEVALPAGRMATRLMVPSHPVFHGVWNDQVAFPPLPQRMARRCMPVPAATTLAVLAGEFPLLVELPVADGRVFWINAGFDRGWGDFPLSPAYVALVQQLARAGALARQSTTLLRVGEAWPVLHGPDRAAAWPAGSNGEPTTRAEHRGIFTATGAGAARVWRCAVNVDRAESLLRPKDPAALKSILPGTIAAGGKAVDAWRAEARRDVPLWPWLLAAAAMVFAGEGMLASRLASLRGGKSGSPVPVIQASTRRRRR